MEKSNVFEYEFLLVVQAESHITLSFLLKMCPFLISEHP